MISLALASLASVRCTKKDQAQLNKVHNDIEEMAAACTDVTMPPQPPHEMFDAVELCFGEYECPLDVKLKIAQWVYDLSIWVREAHECAVQVKGSYRDYIKE